MANKDHIRPLAGVPDHGFGLLGRLTHSVLAEYTGTVPTVPQLHLGQNTLPDPPFPMAAMVPFGDLSEGWRECDEDVAAFLRVGARTLLNQPLPAISAYSERIRTLQRVLRFDSIAMAWHDPGRSAFSIVAVVVDRAGNALTGHIPAGGTSADIRVIDSQPSGDDLIIGLLRDVLLAQYEWTSKVFGLVP
ncbi:MAG: hypothetical protein ACRDNS_19940 [Trebonia sp.]